MIATATNATLDEGFLSNVVERILASGKPSSIVLFGSQARGDANPHSDLDLLIVEESTLPRYERSFPYYKALRGVYPAKDILVWTSSEIDQWSSVAGHFITRALREGRVLYER